MRTIRRLVILAGLALALSVPMAAAHATTEPACTTVTSQLDSRPENGNHGQWATDNLTRTVIICPGNGENAYHAGVADAGTFTTISGSSPQAGVPLQAGVTGSVHGSYTADFTTSGPLDLDTLTGPPHETTTGAWVQTIIGAAWASGSSINDDWTWTYTTPCEQWVDAADNSDGELPADGDITGPCPEQTTTTIVDTTTTTVQGTTTTTGGGGQTTTSGPAARAGQTTINNGGDAPATSDTGSAAPVLGDEPTGHASTLPFTGAPGQLPVLLAVGLVAITTGAWALHRARTRHT